MIIVLIADDTCMKIAENIHNSLTDNDNNISIRGGGSMSKSGLIEMLAEIEKNNNEQTEFLIRNYRALSQPMIDFGKEKKRRKGQRNAYRRSNGNHW